jgi:hypothetical protein
MLRELKDRISKLERLSPKATDKTIVPDWLFKLWCGTEHAGESVGTKLPTWLLEEWREASLTAAGPRGPETI